MTKIILSKKQKSAVNQFKEKLSKNIYTEEANPCICQGHNDIMIGEKDRYGMDLRTVLCKECLLVRSDPYYSEETLSSFYDNEYRIIYTDSNLATKDFFDEEERIGERIVKYILETVEGIEIKGKIVYEIGCGAGGILNAFKNSGAEVLGCDYGEKYLEFGRKKGLNLVHGGIESFSKFKKADIIILNHVLEHFKDPKTELDKISKLLKDRGTLYIAVPGLLNHHNSYGSLRNYLQNAHVFNYNLETLEQIMFQSGYSMIKGDQYLRAVFKKEKKLKNPKRKKNWLPSYLYLKISYVVPFIYNSYSFVLKFIKRTNIWVKKIF